MVGDLAWDTVYGQPIVRSRPKYFGVAGPAWTVGGARRGPGGESAPEKKRRTPHGARSSAFRSGSIGAPGFEPGTSCSRSRRANRAALRPVIRAGALRRPATQLMRPRGLEPLTF